MQIKTREDFLKAGVAVVVGLLLLDSILLTPALKRWKAQGERIEKLEAQVTNGKRLLLLEKSIRAKWAEMQASDLNPEISDAEAQGYSGISKWANGKGLSMTSLSPNWRTQDPEFDLFEFRATATGSQAALGQFIYGLETDALPVRLDECELTARDNKGQQLTGSMRFSFIRLKGGAR